MEGYSTIQSVGWLPCPMPWYGILPYYRLTIYVHTPYWALCPFPFWIHVHHLTTLTPIILFLSLCFPTEFLLIRSWFLAPTSLRRGRFGPQLYPGWINCEGKSKVRCSSAEFIPILFCRTWFICSCLICFVYLNGSILYLMCWALHQLMHSYARSRRRSCMQKYHPS